MTVGYLFTHRTVLCEKTARPIIAKPEHTHRSVLCEKTALCFVKRPLGPLLPNQSTRFFPVCLENSVEFVQFHVLYQILGPYERIHLLCFDFTERLCLSQLLVLCRCSRPSITHLYIVTGEIKSDDSVSSPADMSTTLRQTCWNSLITAHDVLGQLFANMSQRLGP